MTQDEYTKKTIRKESLLPVAGYSPRAPMSADRNQILHGVVFISSCVKIG